MPAKPQALDPQKSYAVFASAGTGKTWLLVARLLRLLLAGAQPETILAITFTRKAAAEIQQRLVERLQDWLTASDAELCSALQELEISQPELHLEMARSLFEKVQFANPSIRITTFHAFFQNLLQRFPLEAEIPAGFTILTDVQAAKIYQEAETQLLQQTTRASENYLAVELQEIARQVRSPRTLRHGLQAFQGRILEWRAYTEGRNFEDLCKHLHDDIFKLPKDPPKRSFEKADILHMAELFEKSGASENSNQSDAAKKLRHALTLGSLDDFNTLRAIYGVFFNNQRKPKSSLWLTAEAPRKRLGNKARKYEKLLEKLSTGTSNLYEWMLREQSYRLNRAWYAVASQMSQLYQQLKLNRGFLDFDDLLWYAHRLMTQGDLEWVQYKLGQRFEHVLVDEFQDTDALSWQTLQSILETLTADTSMPGTAFIVGDAKQSIYQWRRANPEIQNHAWKYIRQQLKAKKTPLDKSYRSARAILTFVNTHFEGSKELPDFHEHLTEHADMWGRVALLPQINERKNSQKSSSEEAPLRDPLTTPREREQETAGYQRAQKIAEQLHSIIYAPTIIRNPDPHGPRHIAARYRDCMILVRRRTHVPLIERALAAAGIPFARQSRQTLFQHLEVQDMHALLQALLHPYDNLALAQVLRSPLYAVTDEEMMELARVPSTLATSWRQKLEILAESKSAEHPFSRAAKHLDDWSALVGHLPPHDLLDRIYFDADALYCYRRAWPGTRGAQAASNLTRLLEIALELDSGRYPSLAAFVHYVEDIREGRIEGKNAPSLIDSFEGEEDNRVQILTVHAAKGLEKPIIVYAELRKPSSQEKVGDILLDWSPTSQRPEYFVFKADSANMDEISRECMKTTRAKRDTERLNQDYVAFTRARQILILCQHPEEHKRLSKTIKDAGGFEDPDTGICALESGTPASTADESPQTLRRTPGDGPITLPSGQSDVSESSVRDEIDGEENDWPAGKPGRIARMRGDIIHKILQLLVTQKNTPVTLARVAAKAYRTTEDKLFQSCLAEAQAVVEAPELMSIFQPGPEVQTYTEVPIVAQHQGGEVFGKIDLLLLSPDRVWIIDYKTHATTDKQELDQHAKKYQEQMKRYAKCIHATYPNRKICCSLLFTHTRHLCDMPEAVSDIL